jgi:Leucine-rich repeat (LRR) protein
MKKTVLFIALNLSFSGIIKAQIVNIPDPAFKAYLLGEAAINSNSDGEIQVSEAAAFTGALYVPNPAVTDLTGIEAFTAITGLNCSNNPITSLNLSQNTALTFLGCAGTQISTLDLTANPALFNVNFSDIPTLNSINIANGNNTIFTSFFAINVPNLTCIQVDDAAYSTSNWVGMNFQFDAQIAFSEACNACYVNIPDAAFKSYLLADPGINTNGNSEIECSEASAYTGSISCGNISITDLTGIEAFTALTALYCQNSQLSTLDLSANTALQELNCAYNQLSSLNLSTNTALTYLACVNNQITALDLSQNTALIYLECDNNDLTALNLSANTALEEITCSENTLTSLNVNNISGLTYIDCSRNNLTSLNLNDNPLLTEIICEFNAITELHLSIHTQLEYLIARDNQLMILDITNGNNTAIIDFDTRNNPNLGCIQVDDAAYSTANWTDIDPVSVFSENCQIGLDENQGTSDLFNASIFPNPTNGLIQLTAASNIALTTITGQVVADAKNVLSLDISGAAPGVYIATLTDENGKVKSRIKIIKE